MNLLGKSGMLLIRRMLRLCLAIPLFAGAAEEGSSFWETLGRILKDGPAAAPVSVQEPPVAVPAEPRLQTHFQRDWEAWFVRAVVERCFPEGPPETLGDFLDRAIPAVLVENERTSPTQFAGFQEEASRWVEGGQDHPLLFYLLWKAQAQASPNASRDQKLLRRAWEHPGLPAAPPFLRFRLADARYRTEKELNRDAKPWLKKRFELMTECLNDSKTYGPGDEEMLVENCHWMLESKSIGQFEPEFQNWMAGVAMTPWSRDALLGEFHIQKAWEARGGGWARDVTEEGWKMFEHHLGEARKHLEAAWQRNPRIPFAAGRMITVAMGQCHPGGDSCRSWFDRAITAQFDYADAYNNYLWAIRPRWGGSHEQMLSFGRACALTKRFNCRVPGVLFKAAADVDGELEEKWRSLYADPALVDLLVETSRGYLAESEPQAVQDLRRSKLVYVAWAASRYDLAAQELQQLHSKLHRDVEWQLNQHQVSPGRILGEIALVKRSLLSAWQRVEKSYEAGELAEAAQAMEELKSKLEPNSHLELVEQRDGAIQLESALQGGDWVPLKVAAGLPGWEIRSGRWSAGPEDELVLTGEGAPALTLFPARVGNHFEIKGSCRNSARKDSVGWGIVLGYHRQKDQDRYVTCCTWKSNPGMRATLLEKFNLSDFPPRPIAQGGEESTFHITVRGNKISFRVNGEVVASEVEVHHKVTGKLMEIPATSWIGFGHHQAPRGEMLRIRGVQIRRLENSKWADAPADLERAPADCLAARTR